MLNMITMFAAELVVNGFATLAATFPNWDARVVVTYVPPPALSQGEEFTETITYKFVDPNGLEAAATVSATSVGVNDPPRAWNVNVIVHEDEVDRTLPFRGTDVDNDDDQRSLAYAIDFSTLTVFPHPRVILNEGDGSFTVRPDAHSLQSLSEGNVTNLGYFYSATDRHGGTDLGVIMVQVTGVNDVPVATSDWITVIEGTPGVVDVLANDMDPDADDDSNSLTLIGVTFESGASVSYMPRRPINP